MSKEKQHLVPVSIIRSLTGWNHRWMAKARANGLVQQVCILGKTGKRQIRYDLNSLRKEFIINRSLLDS